MSSEETLNAELAAKYLKGGSRIAIKGQQGRYGMWTCDIGTEDNPQIGLCFSGFTQGQDQNLGLLSETARTISSSEIQTPAVGPSAAFWSKMTWMQITLYRSLLIYLLIAVLAGFLLVDAAGDYETRIEIGEKMVLFAIISLVFLLPLMIPGLGIIYLAFILDIYNYSLEVCDLASNSYAVVLYVFAASLYILIQFGMTAYLIFKATHNVEISVTS